MLIFQGSGEKKSGENGEGCEKERSDVARDSVEERSQDCQGATVGMFEVCSYKKKNQLHSFSTDARDKSSDMTTAGTIPRELKQIND